MPSSKNEEGPSPPSVSIADIKMVISFIVGLVGAGGIGLFTRPGDIQSAIAQSVSVANASDDVRLKVLEQNVQQLNTKLDRIEQKLDDLRDKQ